MVISISLLIFSGPEAEAHGGAADVCGVRPCEQGADRGPGTNCIK